MFLESHEEIDVVGTYAYLYKTLINENKTNGEESASTGHLVHAPPPALSIGDRSQKKGALSIYLGKKVEKCTRRSY